MGFSLFNHQDTAVWKFNTGHSNFSADEVEVLCSKGYRSSKVWFHCYNDIKIYLKQKCVFMTKPKLVKGIC